jgi:hypothetical protein
MSDFVTYNGSQYSVEKLNTIKGDGAKTSVQLEKLYEFNKAPTAKVSSLIVTPYMDGFAVIAKPEGEIKFPAAAHIVSKVVLKKIKHDPNAKYFDPSTPPVVQNFDRPRYNNYNARVPSYRPR